MASRQRSVWLRCSATLTCCSKLSLHFIRTLTASRHKTCRESEDRHVSCPLHRCHRNVSPAIKSGQRCQQPVQLQYLRFSPTAVAVSGPDVPEPGDAGRGGDPE